MNKVPKNANSAKTRRYLIYRRQPEDCTDIGGEIALLEHQLREAALLNRTAVVDHLRLRGVDGRCIKKAPHWLVAMDRCRLHGPGQPRDGAALQWMSHTDAKEFDASDARIIDASCNHRIGKADNNADVLIRDLSGMSPDSLQYFKAENLYGYRVRIPIAADIEALAHRTIAKLQGLDKPNLHHFRSRPNPLMPKQWEELFSYVWVDIRRQPDSASAARRCLKKIASLIPECRIPFYVCADGYAAGTRHRTADLLRRHYDIHTRNDFKELQPYLDQGEASKCQPWVIDCVEFLIMIHACAMFHSQASMRHDFALLGPEARIPGWRILYVHGRMLAKYMLKAHRPKQPSLR